MSEKESIKKISKFIRSLNKDELKLLDKIRSPVMPYVSIPNGFLKEPDKIFLMDTYYGMLNMFKINKIPGGEYGTKFHPVFNRIQKLKNKYPDEPLLTFIERRTAYVEILKEEMEYLFERFIWEKIEDIYDIFISRFENIIEQTSELFIMTINLYEKIKKNSNGIKIDKFEDILKEFFPNESNLPDYYNKAYDPYLRFSVYIYIRNKIVHDVSKIEYIKSATPRITIRNIPHENRYTFNTFNLFFKKVRNQITTKLKPSSVINVKDSDFPNFVIELSLSKQCTPQPEKTKLYFEMKIINLVDRIYKDLWRLQMDLFDILVKELNI